MKPEEFAKRYGSLVAICLTCSWTYTNMRPPIVRTQAHRHARRSLTRWTTHTVKITTDRSQS